MASPEKNHHSRSDYFDSAGTNDTLNKIIAAVAEAHDLETLLEITLDQLFAAFQVEDGAIWLMGAQVSRNLPTNLISAFTGITQTTAPVAISDWQNGQPKGFPPGVMSAFKKSPVRATLLVPILNDSRVIGRFVLLSSTPRNWTSQEFGFARLIGRQLGIAAEKMSLGHSPSPRENHLPQSTRLQDRPYTLDEVVHTIGQSAMGLLETEQAAIYYFPDEWHARRIWSHNSPDQLDNGEGIGPLVDLIRHQVLINGTPLLVPAVDQADPEMEGRAAFLSAGVQAFGLWPLIYRGKIQAVLACFSSGARNWQENDLDAIEAFTRQSAVSLKNAFSLQVHERRARQLAALNEIAQSLTSTLELEPLLNKILSSAVEILTCEAGSLLLTDEARGGLVFTASVGDVAEHLIGLHIPAGAGIAGKAQASGETLTVNNVLQSKEWFAQTDQETGFTTKSLLVAPMKIKDRVLGVVEVINKIDGSPFLDEDSDILTTLASQAAIALDNARLFEAERRRTQELESLRQASLQLSSSLELQPVLEAILEHALKLVKGDQAHIYLYDGRKLTTGVSLWTSGTRPERVAPPQEYGLIHTIARTGKRIYIPDTSEYSIFRNTPQEAAVVGLPLRKGERIRGVMSISFATAHEFDSGELRVLELLADQAAFALENASLYGDLQDRVNELSNLSDASAALRDAESLTEMGPLLATQAALLVNADITLVYLLEPDRQRFEPVGVYGLTAPIKQLEAYLNSSFLAQTLRTGSLQYMSETEIPTISVEEGFPHELRPALCIPIRTTRGQVVGVFLIARQVRAAGRRSEFRAEELRLLKTLAEIAGNALVRAQSHQELESAYFQTVLALANAMDARDTYTSDHSQRLAILAEATAIEMNCSPDVIQAVHWGALLHDIGKIGVPDEVLSKPGPLNETEWAVMQRHPDIGANIVTPLKRLTEVVPIIRAHQEKYDGSGYPLGLAGEDIPLPARILAVVDAYSAITDERVYRAARSHEEALEEIQSCMGSHFDPIVVKAFLQVVEKPWEG